MSELLDTFGIEWPKFLAQLILFIVVYFILKRFAFGPIIAMLEERRRRIEEGQLNAEKIKQQLAEAEKRHAEILAKAMAQLKQELGRLVVDTTAKVTGKVLSPEDQRRLQEEASRQLA
jgi:F-type H+-transporting ATPase subunit b